MEVLAQLLLESGRNNSSFHPRCDKVKLTHLCFADDLLIFSASTVDFVYAIKHVLMEFESLSGLQTSPEKSTLFCAGISDGTKIQLVDCLQIREGKLLVRYFGVSLISSRLNVANCATLLDKITHRMHSWLSKNLSFASRLQLISFVLYSIQVYWTSIFCLPKKVIHVVEQKFSRFLWNGKVDGAAKVKVSWQDLCVPKQEGGLGIKSLEIWNWASMMRHIWSVFARSDSI